MHFGSRTFAGILCNLSFFTKLLLSSEEGRFGLVALDERRSVHGVRAWEKAWVCSCRRYVMNLKPS